MKHYTFARKPTQTETQSPTVRGYSNPALGRTPNGGKRNKQNLTKIDLELSGNNQT